MTFFASALSTLLSAACPNCAGQGVLATSVSVLNAGGNSTYHHRNISVCTTCNGCGFKPDDEAA